MLIAVDRRRYPPFVLRVLGVEGEAPLVPRRVPVTHVVYWLTWALHGYLVNRAVGADHASAVAGAGLYVIAPILGFLALIMASVNIFGGFLVTQRMLSMYKKKN